MADRQRDIWTVSGRPWEIQVHHYASSTKQAWDQNTRVIDLLNPALRIDKPDPAASGQDPSLEYGVVSPSGRYLICEWFGIWPGTGAHAILCVYDLSQRQVILTLGASGGFTYNVPGWLSEEDIFYRTTRIKIPGGFEDVGLFRTSLTTGQSQPLSGDELSKTMSALGKGYDHIQSAKGWFKSLGIRGWVGSGFGVRDSKGILPRYRSSIAAISSDGKLAVVFVPNYGSDFYQILKDGKPLASINTLALKCDAIRQVRFVGHLLCISVRHSETHKVQVWTSEHKPTMVAELAGDLVLDHSDE